MANPNLELLISVARLLRPLLDELVFVGGCTTALLITDPAAAEVRSTYDVDAIAEITSYAERSRRVAKSKQADYRTEIDLIDAQSLIDVQPSGIARVRVIDLAGPN